MPDSFLNSSVSNRCFSRSAKFDLKSLGSAVGESRVPGVSQHCLGVLSENKREGLLLVRESIENYW